MYSQTEYIFDKKEPLYFNTKYIWYLVSSQPCNISPSTRLEQLIQDAIWASIIPKNNPSSWNPSYQIYSHVSALIRAAIIWAVLIHSSNSSSTFSSNAKGSNKSSQWQVTMINQSQKYQQLQLYSIQTVPTRRVAIQTDAIKAAPIRATLCGSNTSSRNLSRGQTVQ